MLREVLELLEHHNPFLVLASLKSDRPVRPYAHQAELLLRTFLRRPIRALIADDIGLGKTITALAIMARLRRMGEVKRALIAVPRILLPQWLSELSRVGLPVKRIERGTFEKLVAQGFPEGYAYLASMDLIKRSPYIDEVSKVPWDLIVVDEAHRLGKATLRYDRIGGQLIEAHPNRHAILLSATPHRGDPEDYIFRLRLLDPYLSPGKHLDSREFYRATHNVLVFRRTKEDVNDVYERRKIFTECRLRALVVAASEEEARFHEELAGFLRSKLLEYYEKVGEKPAAMGLLMTLVFKRASSSPYAALKTMERMLLRRAGRIKREELDRRAGRLADSLLGVGFDDYEEAEEELRDPDEELNRFAEDCSALLSQGDVVKVKELAELAKAVAERDSRLNVLIELLKLHLGQGRKVVVFTEFKDTAEYVQRALESVFGGRTVVKLTGEEAGDERKLGEVRRRFERDPECRVLVATDVASEGLNLQVASVLVNYDVPWSLVKLDQRLGRLWRLGQPSDVDAYTIFLSTKVDRDCLDCIYKKLLARGRAVRSERPPIGEEAYVIDVYGEDLALQLGEVVKGERRVKATEYRLILEYLRGGRSALLELVDYMVEAIKRLNEELRSKGVMPRPTPEEVDRLLGGLTGFRGAEDVEVSLKRLLRALLKAAPRLGGKVDFVEEGDKLVLFTRGGAPAAVSDACSALDALKMVLDGLTATPKYLVARGDEEGELRVYEARIETADGRVVYSEPVGLYTTASKVEVFRGGRLLDALSSALENLLFTVDEHAPIGGRPPLALEEAIKRVNDTFSEELHKYREWLSRRGWRDFDDEWLPKLGGYHCRVSRLLGTVRFTSEATAAMESSIDLSKKRSIERIAMEVAMNYEKASGREPIDVSEREHFDILSRDPVSGQERLIEVKGHSTPSLMVELTEEEYRVASRERSRYWLYIVHSISLGSPQLVAIQDPLSKMRVEEVTSRKYRLRP